jgi:hypothetical protein
VSFDKILRRIKTIGQEVGVKINYTNLVIKVIDQLYDNISTTKLDELSAEQCAVMASIHTDYNISPEESRFPTTIKTRATVLGRRENPLRKRRQRRQVHPAHLKRTIRHRVETPSLSTGSATTPATIS